MHLLMLCKLLVMDICLHTEHLVSSGFAHLRLHQLLIRPVIEGIDTGMEAPSAYNLRWLTVIVRVLSHHHLTGREVDRDGRHVLNESLQAADYVLVAFTEVGLRLVDFVIANLSMACHLSLPLIHLSFELRCDGRGFRFGPIHGLIQIVLDENFSHHESLSQLFLRVTINLLLGLKVMIAGLEIINRCLLAETCRLRESTTMLISVTLSLERRLTLHVFLPFTSALDRATATPNDLLLALTHVS